MSAEQCNRCRYWREEMRHRDRNDENWGFGHCRRNPPLVSDAYVAVLMPRLEYGQQVDPEIDAVQMIAASLFPATTATDWCGKFKGMSA